jgi:hypothetical protein
MRVTFSAFLFLVLFSPSLNSQEQNKPKISGITIMPSESVMPNGDCKSSTAGYLEKSRPPRTMSDEEMGNFISKSLHDGYIVSIYPLTKTGIFVTMECTNTTASVAP